MTEREAKIRASLKVGIGVGLPVCGAALLFWHLEALYAAMVIAGLTGWVLFVDCLVDAIRNKHLKR